MPASRRFTVTATINGKKHTFDTTSTGGPARAARTAMAKCKTACTGHASVYDHHFDRQKAYSLSKKKKRKADKVRIGRKMVSFKYDTRVTATGGRKRRSSKKRRSSSGSKKRNSSSGSKKRKSSGSKKRKSRKKRSKGKRTSSRRRRRRR